MLEKEFKYYLDHQNELVKSHYGRYIVIKDEKILGDFGSEIEAVLYARNEGKLELGTFLVQQCMPGKENYTQFFANLMFT
jgi:hypothetical protein